MPAEIEAKFRAEGPGPLAALAAEPRLGDAAIGPARTTAEVDRYLDTADGRLADRQWACRLREREGRVRVSLKGPAEAGSGGWLHRRPELEGPATTSLDPEDWPRSEARDFVERLRDGAPLIERFRLRQERTERAVLIDETTRLGTLSLDVVAVWRGERQAGELFVVELELADAVDQSAAASLERLASVLARRPGLHADPRTKLEHALERLAPS